MNEKICVVGLGYVGLPLAVEFGKHYDTVGFDIDISRIEELKDGIDRTLEVEKEELQTSSQLSFTAHVGDIQLANIYIITVPTPIDEHKKPDLRPLEKSSTTIGKVLKRGDIVIYESTVYPGCTEEVCVPILEQNSNLVFNKDFFVGYSPERINPGDKVHRLSNIIKVVSGSTQKTAKQLQRLYGSIIEVGIHLASSIKVAEAAKVIENTQRDLNIAFINELSIIFEKLGIDTLEVLKAAQTKWNFLSFTPGLVGGHCIGVDPYYLTYKAEALNYQPQVILSGRRINDGMGKYIAGCLVKNMMQNCLRTKGASVLILGITFKENCSDIRNSKVIDIIHELKDYNLQVDVYDPHAHAKEVYKEYGIKLIKDIQKIDYEAAVLAVGHQDFKSLDVKKYLIPEGILFDVKGLYEKEYSDMRL